MNIKINKRTIALDGYLVFKGMVEGHRVSASYDGDWKVFLLSETGYDRGKRERLYEDIKLWLIQNEKELLDGTKSNTD